MALIIVGCVGLIILGLTSSESTWGVKLSAALFQSISSRTAGFNTVDIGVMPLSSLLLLVLLMFIGGSPGSCAGGIKTTALAISLAEFKAKLKGEDQVVMLDRRVSTNPGSHHGVDPHVDPLNLLGLLLLLYTETGRPGWASMMSLSSKFPPSARWGSPPV